MEYRLGQVGSVVMGFLEGRLESLMEEEREGGSTGSSSLSEVGTSGVSGDGPDDQGGDEDNEVGGVSPRESTRPDSPMLREEGLITQMEREVTEAGLGGWFNGNPEDVPESWSGPNSDALISCLSWQYSGLHLSPTLPTLLPAPDIPDRCTIRGLLHDYCNPPPTDYFRIFPTICSILRP